MQRSNDQAEHDTLVLVAFVLVGLAAFAISTVTLFSGLGLGTLLMPLFACPSFSTSSSPTMQRVTLGRAQLIGIELVENPSGLQQAAAIPFRRQGGKARYCLISTQSKRWGVPRGLIDAGLTPEDTALKEAAEEAGLQGRLLGEPLGTYTYAKWGTTLTVTVFLMEVADEADSWEEMAARRKCWVSAAEAERQLTGHPILPLLKRALARVGPRSGPSSS